MTFKQPLARAGRLPLGSDGSIPSAGHRVKGPIAYPGAKIKIAGWIVDLLPKHRVYVEPFSGSASVFFRKNAAECEVLNDRNGDITHYLTVVRDRPSELREWLEETPYSRQYFHEIKERWFDEGERPDDPIQRAGEYFAVLEQGYTGDLEPGGFSRPSVHTNTWKVRTWQNKINDRINAAAERLRDTCIENLDYRECIDAYDCEDAVVYCDPPYFERSTDYGAEDFCHEVFAEAVRGLDARVVVSYDDLPPSFVDLVNEKGWKVAEKDATRTVVNYQSTDETKERLVMNFDSSDEIASQSVLDGDTGD